MLSYLKTGDAFTCAARAAASVSMQAMTEHVPPRALQSPSTCTSDGEDILGAIKRSDGDAHGLYQCMFCYDPIATTKDLAYDSGRPVHFFCLKKMPYVHREARKQCAEKAIRFYESKHPSDFAYRMKDMSETRPDPAHRRGSLARVGVDSLLTECIEFEKTSTVRPTLFLCARTFKAWYMREKLFTSEEADKRWLEDKNDKNVRRKIEDRTLKLAVVGHTQEMRESGSIVQAKTTPAESTESTVKRALVEDDREFTKAKKSRVHSEDRTTSGLGRRWSSRLQRRRSSSSGSAVRRGRSKSRSTSPRSQRKPHLGQVRVRARMGYQELRGSSPSVDPERGSFTPRAREKTGAPFGVAPRRVSAKQKLDEGGTPKIMSAEDLIQDKMDIGLSAQDSVEQLGKCVDELKKSILNVQEDNDDREKLEQFDMDADLENVEHMKEDMVGLLKTVRSAKLSGFGAAKDAEQDKKKDIDDLVTRLNSC